MEYKPIDNGGKKIVDSKHLENATKEYSERFTFCTEEEDAESNQFSCSPYLSVAINVKSTWSAPLDFARFRFMLVAMEESSSALFISRAYEAVSMVRFMALSLL